LEVSPFLVTVLPNDISRFAIRHPGLKFLFN